MTPMSRPGLYGALLLISGYVLLDWASYIHPLYGLNITPWNPGPALAIVMLFGRFFLIIPTLAIAGALVRKRHVPATVGTFPTDTPLFVVLVLGVAVIVAALAFLPALALGPIVEQLKI